MFTRRDPSEGEHQKGPPQTEAGGRGSATPDRDGAPIRTIRSGASRFEGGGLLIWTMEAPLR